MSHHCHAQHCEAPVPPKMFMCRRHWYMVPAAMRRAIWREYEEGQEIRKDPTVAYLDVTQAAIAAVAEREARP